jgi:ABC-type polysaccharide/polyol phosphate export permease
MTGLFWLSGVFWDTYGIENDTLRRLMYINPINYFVNGYRKSFLYDEFIFERRGENIVFFVELIVVILWGAHNYKKLRKTLPDIL